MPRYIFPASTVTNTTGAAVPLAFYATSATGRREADLWTVDGSSNLLERIPNGIILADVTTGAYSAFAGPDDVDTLYLSADGGARTAITATTLVTGQGGTYLNGTFAKTWTSPTASTTLTGTLAAWVITAVDCTAGAGARTLPAASSVTAGTSVCAKKADTSANNLVVSRAGSDLIYGTGSGATSKTLTLSGEAVEFVSNGVDKWTVRSSDTPSAVLASTYAASGVPSHAGTRLKRYDPNSNGYNWKASNTRRLRASLGKAQWGTGAAHHAFIGDSETDAYTGVTEQLKMWPLWYRSVLATLGVTVGGDGFVRASSLSAAIDPRWTYSGTWTTNLQWASTVVNGATATFTSDQAGTKVDVAYFGNSGAFTVAIDGAGAVTVTPADGSPIVRKYSVTGLANTTHTVVITTTSTTTTYIIGACLFSASGLVVHNIAMYGSRSSDYTSSTTTSGYREIYRLALPTTPDVVWIALGVNDIRNSVAVATAKANVQTLMAAYPSSDIILVGQYSTSDAAMSNWPSWVSALYDIADSSDIPLLDLYDRSGGYTIANGNGLMGDTIHPNGAGQRDWGRAATLLAAR